MCDEYMHLYDSNQTEYGVLYRENYIFIIQLLSIMQFNPSFSTFRNLIPQLFQHCQCGPKIKLPALGIASEIPKDTHKILKRMEC